MMKRFEFDHFPEESEILPFVEQALLLQCQNNALNTICKKAKLVCAHDKDYSIEDFITDANGMQLLYMMHSAGVPLERMSELDREDIAMLWTNYMCNSPRMYIIDNVFGMLEKGVDYKAYSLKITNETLQMKNGVKTETEHKGDYLGAVLYLWTLLCVVRRLKRANGNAPFSTPATNYSMN